MKGLLFNVALILLAASVYMGAPFVTAWSIREAVRNGDSAYLERVIDWPGVRETLKPAVSRIALNLPDPETQPLTEPGLWQRFKVYWGQGAVDRAVDSYITPEGLPQLFAARKAYRSYMSVEPDEAQTTPVLERIQRAWARVKRAEFTSFTTFEIDMTDKYDESRLYLGKLELTDIGWKLKELRVKFLTSAGSAVLKFADSGRQAVRGGFIAKARAAAQINR